MKLVTAFAIVICTGTAFADRAVHKLATPDGASNAAPYRGPIAAHDLTLAEVTAQVKPVSSDIERCYLAFASDVRGAGHLDVKLGIANHGDVFSVDVATPGLSPKLGKYVQSCVRSVVTGLHFPAHRGDTTAVVPFYFQHTDAPGAGPQPSCWDPKGCH